MAQQQPRRSYWLKMDIIGEMSAKYMWWRSGDGKPFGQRRVLAQVMDIGDWGDVLRVLDDLGEGPFRDVLAHAEPGWLKPRSWSYWHYRLGIVDPGEPIPPLPKRPLIQDSPDTLTLNVRRGGGTVKVSFFGDLVPKRINGRVGEPEYTPDRALLVAAIDDLFATKVKVVLDRAEAKDYRDIAALLRSGASLERALGAAQSIYGSAYQPTESIKALSCFDDGDLSTLDASDRRLLTAAAASVGRLPNVALRSATLV